MVGLGSGSQADGLDFRGEFNGGGQLDQGDVIADAEGSPFRVDGVFGGPDLNAGGFLGGGQTDIVGAEVNVEKDSGIGTVGGSQNPLVGNKRTTAEVLVIDEQSHLPWERVWNGLSSSNDTAACHVSLSAETASVDGGGALDGDEGVGIFRW